MRVQLTDRFCERAKTAGQTDDYFDETIPGLALRVGKRSKSWSLHFSADGRRKRVALGSYPSLSLAAARRKALEAKTAIEQGLDPKTVIGADTLQAIAEAYLRLEAPERSKAYYTEQLTRLVYPALGQRPVREIRRSEITRMLDAIEAPVMADMVLKIVRRVLNWYAVRDDDFVSPIVRGMRPQKAKARDRVLTDEEIKAVWHADAALGPMVRFLLLTGARRTEAYNMTWDEITGSEWLLPKARNKTKLDLLRPLSRAAMELIEAQRGATFVFPHQDLARGKSAFDAAAGVSGWTLHDLRRTARSLMSRAGVPSDHAERCLGHVIGGVRGVYDRYEYRDEKAMAYEKLAGLIERIVDPQDRVVAIRGER